ncbi:hypothetical protein Y032_0185g1035 [Ancylostoma ceylanicum]|uniref:Uncharacterized protein n=1 Tax=Ancylostoma ceylanicum TaxID=53326 RepID=A0A016SR64_9BILA|nr:hypothetical protein Y032_0185g1035 [Ancylostoma ceylanicum]
MRGYEVTIMGIITLRCLTALYRVAVHDSALPVLAGHLFLFNPAGEFLKDIQSSLLAPLANAYLILSSIKQL